MRTHPLRLNLVLVVACLLSILLFVVGNVFPITPFLGRFLLPIVVVFLWGSDHTWRRDMYIVTGLASALAAAAYWLNGPRTIPGFLINYLLPFAVLWGATWLLAQRRALQEQLARNQLELEQQVQARTAELIASERRYRLIAENAGDLIWTVDMTGTITYASPAAQRVRGVTGDEEQSASWFDRMPPEVAARAAAALQADLAALRAGQPIDGTPRAAPAYRKDGTLMWSETVMSALYDEDGKPLGLCGTTRDITARKELEEKLRASEARYRLLAENSNDLIWAVDMNGALTYVSAAVERMRGVTSEEELSTSWSDRLPPEAEAQIGAAIERDLAALRAGLPIAATPYTAPAYRKDGSLMWVETVVSALYDEDGRPVGISCATRDITARHEAEAQLREANQRLQLATGAAGIGIWAWNFADSSLEWDARMCEMHAVTPAERQTGISYDLWRSRIHPDDVALVLSAQGDPSRAREQPSAVYRIVLPGGAIRYIQASALVECAPDGQPHRIIGANRDITDQVHYERLLQDTNAELEERVAARTADLEAALAELQRANGLKDEFMAMISHELRTPLTGVFSMSEMLEEQIAGPLNGRQLFYVKNIVQSGERLLQVVNGILSYTHLLGGKVKLQAEPCELAYLLDTCAVSQQRKAAEKHQAIAVQVLPPDLTITADVTALAEVLKCLLDNAVKFTPAGGQIGLEAQIGTASGTVDLVVWDTGIGIAADQLDHVFHAFTQADGQLSRSHEGLGLGLAYVYEMVRLMGGTVNVESTPGAGSRFTVMLPICLKA